MGRTTKNVDLNRHGLFACNSYISEGNTEESYNCLQESNKNPRQQENLLRGRRFTNLPHRITFRTEIAMTRWMLNQFNGNKRQAENWVRAKVQDANRIFKHHTLHTKLTIQVVNEGNIKIVEENMVNDGKLLNMYNRRYVGGKYP